MALVLPFLISCPYSLGPLSALTLRGLPLLMAHVRRGQLQHKPLLIRSQPLRGAMQMLEALRAFLSVVGKFFLGVFGRSPAQPEISPSVLIPPVQSQPLAPVPPPPSPIIPLPLPPVTPSPILHGPQSHWWDGSFAITQPYGCSDYSGEGYNPFHPECQFFHEGIDFGMPLGTPIYAGRTVHVIALDPPGYGPPGNSAAIALYDGIDTVWLYHMEGYTVALGDVVPRGGLIGYSGSRGYSTGPHLHFEVRPDGAAYRHSVDPTYWLLG